MLSVGYLVLGLILLVLGGEFVVRGASNLAKSFGISQLVVGLTVVAFGTSAPELGVSIMASIEGNVDIAIANVVGSNIFNNAFILGLCAVISPLIVNLQLLKLDIPILIAASVIAFLFSLDGRLEFFEGIILLGGVIAYTSWLIIASRKENSIHEEVSSSESQIFPQGRFLNLIFISLGIVLLVYGSKFLVSGASALALLAGIPQTVVGLTVVAAGTSLPELVSSIMATIKGKTDIAIGNVIGSGIFNLLFILGTSSVVTENGLSITENILAIDFPIMLGLAVISFPLLVTGKKLVRWEGGILLSSYICYTIFLFFRG